ncbi:hypothetical protein RF11_09758 [Thelohanellus kitauei]|uniref:Tc1-like transposase DDE domain-containing protein n=1 Tax=Thelohanellus kitauei TaxID=669202 RepID=A0A0C2MZ77_THEKT|nr:hypothetical protein RF11_09758 [Thelohanellus kitauei]
MNWTGGSRYIKTLVIKIYRTMYSKEYQKMLESLIGGPPVNIIFQQDNAPNTSLSQHCSLTKTKTKLIEWPSCSPDLNIIENVWSKLSSIVSIYGRKYENLEEL